MFIAPAPQFSGSTFVNRKPAYYECFFRDFCYCYVASSFHPTHGLQIRTHQNRTPAVTSALRQRENLERLRK